MVTVRVQARTASEKPKTVSGKSTKGPSASGLTPGQECEWPPLRAAACTV